MCARQDIYVFIQTDTFARHRPDTRAGRPAYKYGALQGVHNTRAGRPAYKYGALQGVHKVGQQASLKFWRYILCCS